MYKDLQTHHRFHFEDVLPIWATLLFCPWHGLGCQYVCVSACVCVLPLFHLAEEWHHAVTVFTLS